MRKNEAPLKIDLKQRPGGFAQRVVPPKTISIFGVEPPVLFDSIVNEELNGLGGIANEDCVQAGGRVR
jgi:hypothetical protein